MLGKREVNGFKRVKSDDASEDSNNNAADERHLDEKVNM